MIAPTNDAMNVASPVGIRKLLRPADVTKVTGMKRSTLYAAIDKGTFPKPVKFGARFAAFPVDEVQAVIDARIAGKDEDAMKALVAQLMEARQKQ